MYKSDISQFEPGTSGTKLALWASIAFGAFRIAVTGGTATSILPEYYGEIGSGS